MKRYLYFLLSIVFAVVLAGCGGEDEIPQPTPEPPTPDPPTPGYSEFFITEYLLVESISYDTKYEQSTSDHSTPLEMPVISLRFYGTNVRGHSNKDEEAFQNFQDMYNDKYYNGQTMPGANPALAYPIDKITLTCHEDFDAEHPAGATVDDIVKMQLVTYETYINNGYSYPEEWEHLNKGTVYPWGLIPKGEFFLSEVNSDVSKVIGVNHRGDASDSPLRFVKGPNVPGDYPFTLEITFNGETVKTRLLITFGNTAK